MNDATLGMLQELQELQKIQKQNPKELPTLRR